MRELRDRVASLAGALKARGRQKGDRVVIYMPMIPQALEAMLACARLGAIHSVVFGGFAARELATRIDDAKPRRSSPPPAGSSRGAWCITSRCWTAPSTWPRTSPTSA
jgi:propionyl-CoA synthetase